MLTLVLLVKIGTSKLVTASLTAANFNDPRPTRKLVLTKGKAYVGSCSSEITSGFAMTLRELPHKHSDPLPLPHYLSLQQAALQPFPFLQKRAL